MILGAIEVIRRRFDSNRSGFVSEQQFKLHFLQHSVVLSPAELSELIQAFGGADGNVDYCKYIMRLLPLEKVGLQSSVAESTSRAVTAKKSEMLLHALRKQVCVTYSSILSSLKLLFTGAKETSRWCQ